MYPSFMQGLNRCEERTLITTSIVIYVLLQVLIGIWASKRVSSQTDFIVAGRSLGFGLATLTIFSTWFGAETIVGAAGSAYEYGLGASGPQSARAALAGGAQRPLAGGR